MEGINPALAGTQQNIAQELMEEDLKRELERNAAATKMAMAKEQEAQEAKRRAQDAQVMMQAMLQKYEFMKNKLDGAKKDLETTSTRIQNQEEVTEKIQMMKERIEAYASRKEAVGHLQDHMNMKFDLQQNGLDFLSNVEEETARFQEIQKVEEEKATRVKAMQEMMKEREKAIEKTDKIKVMLERQLEIGDKKIAEQNRIASVREKLLELKMKELDLQKAKLARRKKEQEEKEKATEDFIAMIDKQLEHMEANVDPITGTIPRQMKLDLEAMGDKLLKNNSSNAKLVQPLLVEAEKKTETLNAQTKSETKEELSQLSPPQNEIKDKTPVPVSVPVSETVSVPEKEVSPEPFKPKNKKNKKKNKNKNRKARSQSRSEEVQSPKLDPEPEPEKVSPSLVEDVNDSEVKETEEAEEKLSEEEVKEMVAKVEGKCKNVKDNIADMAMSEQYLRTKQAMLKAKKKEQEMKIAQRMAELREEEVLKMREKVTRMQELLASRKTELKITEEIIHEKDGEKDNLDKRIEASRRRESYVEKKIVEKKCDSKQNPAKEKE